MKRFSLGAILCNLSLLFLSVPIQGMYSEKYLEACTSAGDDSGLKYFFGAGDHPNFDEVDENGLTLLHRAARDGKVELLKKLIEVPGLDVNVRETRMVGICDHRYFF